MTEEFPKPPTARAKRWMLNEARRLRAEGKIGKRDDLLSRCRKDTGCTKLDAKAAYKNLPDELKRRRGKQSPWVIMLQRPRLRSPPI